MLVFCLGKVEVGVTWHRRSLPWALEVKLCWQLSTIYVNPWKLEVMVSSPIILWLWVIKFKTLELGKMTFSWACACLGKWQFEREPFSFSSFPASLPGSFLQLYKSLYPPESAHTLSHCCPQLGINQGVSWWQILTDHFPSKVLHLSWNLFKTHCAHLI